MFDARSLLEMMVRGADPNSPRSQPSQGSGLQDLLGQLLGGANSQSTPSRGGAGNPAGISGLEDLMRQFTGGATPAGARAAAPTPGAPSNPAQGSGNILEDLLRNIAPQSGGQGTGTGGGLIDILGQILGQATSGVKEGAQHVDNATGASGHLRDILTRTTGKSPEELMNAAKELVEKNKLGTGAAAGGIGAVVLGTETGRALAGSIFKMGALALIGGLAYKAVQNYQAGKPVLGGGAQALVEAPAGSGYESRAVTNDAALLYIRTMIAAAAADGRIDETEMSKVIGGLKQMGLDREAEEFLANELNNPATTRELANGIHGDAEAAQVFTAARIAIDLDTEEEHDFLVRLANDLGLDRQLVAHIDATARQAA